MTTDLSLRVLVAEDDYLVAEMVAGALDYIGYTVVAEASNGQEAIELTLKERPDVVVMDVKMPDVDGIEATRRIQESCPTAVVILSAYETRQLVGDATAAGVGAYLIKPPRANELERAIIVAMARFTEKMELLKLYEETRDTLARIKGLEGLIPICAACKKIRDEGGSWHSLEAFLAAHGNLNFTHGLCPDCMGTMYPDYYNLPDE